MNVRAKDVRKGDLYLGLVVTSSGESTVHPGSWILTFGDGGYRNVHPDTTMPIERTAETE